MQSLCWEKSDDFISSPPSHTCGFQAHTWNKLASPTNKEKKFFQNATSTLHTISFDPCLCLRDQTRPDQTRPDHQSFSVSPCHAMPCHHFPLIFHDDTIPSTRLQTFKLPTIIHRRMRTMFQSYNCIPPDERGERTCECRLHFPFLPFHSIPFYSFTFLCCLPIPSPIFHARLSFFLSFFISLSPPLTH